MWKDRVRKIYNKVHSINNAVQYEGIFSDWETARSKSTRYDTIKIFEKVKHAAIMVRDGKAC